MASYSWPGSVSSSPSVGTLGSPIPSEGDLIAGENPTGNLTAVQVDSSGNIIVSSGSFPTLQAVNLTEIAGAAVNTGHGTASGSLRVELPTDGTGVVGLNAGSNTIGSINNISGTITLPTGAATSANQTNASQKTQIVDGSGNVIASTSNALNVDVTNFPATQPISGTVTANQGTAGASPWVQNLTQVAGASVATGHGTAAGSLRVELPSDGTGVVGLNAGSNIIGKVGIDQTTPGTTNGVQINAALPAGTNNIGKVNSLASTPTALTVTQAAISVGTSAVRLTVSGSAPSATRVVLVATPDTASTATFYIGSNSVTNSGATRGVEIVAGQSFIANNDAGDYYIVASVTSQTVTVMEQA